MSPAQALGNLAQALAHPSFVANKETFIILDRSIDVLDKVIKDIGNNENRDSKENN